MDDAAVEDPRKTLETLKDKKLEIQMKNQRDVLYIRMLYSFGIGSILLGIVLVLLAGLGLGQGFSILVMGLALTLAAALWENNDRKALQTVEERIEDTKADILAGYHN